MLLYGKPVAEKILRGVASRIQEKNLSPGLAVLLVGHDPASHLYVSLKEVAAQKVGIRLEKFVFAADAGLPQLTETIDALNARADIHGIIVQFPLPDGLPADTVIARIDPKKDTDGFHKETLEKFLAGDVTACPVFPRAVFELLLSTRQKLQNKKGLVLANSEMLGKAMAKVLQSFCQESEYVLDMEKGEQREGKIKEADVLVTACGLPRFIKGAMVKDGVIAIDGGITEVGEGKVVGDVDRASVREKALFLSPVPGGVGPVTVACLLARVTEAALERKR